MGIWRVEDAFLPEWRSPTLAFFEDNRAELVPRLGFITESLSRVSRPGHKVYLLLAVIVLLLLFAASYGGPGTWIALASSTLSVLLIAAIAFVANAGSAGPYLNALAAQTPALLRGGVQDLAYAAEQTAALLSEGPQRVAAEPTEQDAAAETPLIEPTPIETTPIEIMPPDTAPSPSAPPAPVGSVEDESAWFDLSWLTPTDWLATAAGWLNPASWFGGQEPGAPEIDVPVGSEAASGAATAPKPQASAPPAPLPTVRAMMQPRDEATQGRSAAAPSYRIVRPPSEDPGPVTASLPDNPATPVKWLADAPAPPGIDRILLSGTNVSRTTLEDIQATLRPDSGVTATGLGNVALSLRLEGPDGTVASGTSVPPGARFHLQAAGLSEDAVQALGGAIVSFAYSQNGRRRTSIMYLEQDALGGGAAEPQ
jgi:hypothetical protein